MSEIIETVDVDVPVRTAYDQWTQFEAFPLFMEGVKKVEQLDDTTLALDRRGRRQGRSAGRRGSPSRSPTSGSPGRRSRAPGTPAS